MPSYFELPEFGGLALKYVGILYVMYDFLVIIYVHLLVVLVIYKNNAQSL